MKVIYDFIYEDKYGILQKFQMPVNVTKETGSDLMRDICAYYFKHRHTNGTPLYAISTSEQYPSYCLCKTTCNDKYQELRFNESSDKKAGQSQPFDGKKIYIYEGKFGKVGQSSRRTIHKSYLLPAPALLTDSLIQDFKKAMNAEKDGIGWKLLGVTLIHELDPQGMTDKEIEKYVKAPEKNLSTPEKKASEEKMIWARISDSNEDSTAWIPALVRDNRILSAIGELDNPDNLEDTREFDDCPIPGYRVVKTSEFNDRIITFYSDMLYRLRY